jgi:3-phosphoshikimate 1-carboxyvinyltransferase
VIRGDELVPGVVDLEPSDSLEGSVHPPGDKSISHRALLLSALADGRSTIEGLSDGDDVARTSRCIEALGARVEVLGTSAVAVDGGRGRLQASDEPLDCGNSGTTMRLLCGVAATIPGRHLLDGDGSLRRRPMDRVARPLGAMGATVEGIGPTCTPPLAVLGGPLRALHYVLPVASAQVKSAILLAGLAADGPTTVVEPVATRVHTEEMLARAAARIEVTMRPDGRHTTVWPSSLAAREWRVPSDPSQAAFFVVAALLVARGEVVVGDLDLSEERTGYLGVLERMDGAVVVQRRPGDRGDVVASSSSLRGAGQVLAAELPSLDEVPILAVAAAAAQGTTTFHDVAELRVKETDRLDAVCRLLDAIGATTTSHADALTVIGLGSASAFHRFEFDARDDHRMAMAAAIAATVGQGGTVRGFGGVATSYPRFLAALASLR